MVAAVAHPNPVALLNAVDLEDAIANLDDAENWLNNIRAVETSIAKIVANAETSGAGSNPEVDKWRNVLPHLRSSREYAEQHVALLTKRTSARAAR